MPTCPSCMTEFDSNEAAPTCPSCGSLAQSTHATRRCPECDYRGPELRCIHCKSRMKLVKKKINAAPSDTALVDPPLQLDHERFEVPMHFGDNDSSTSKPEDTKAGGGQEHREPSESPATPMTRPKKAVKRKKSPVLIAAASPDSKHCQPSTTQNSRDNTAVWWLKPEFLGPVGGLGLVLLVFVGIRLLPKRAPESNPVRVVENRPVTINPDVQTKVVMDTLLSTQHGRDLVKKYGSKDNALTAYQQANGISDEIAEAAIKEWVETHGRNFDWDLDDVIVICMRNKRSGIPFDYLPESAKVGRAPSPAPTFSITEHDRLVQEAYRFLLGQTVTDHGRVLNDAEKRMLAEVLASEWEKSSRRP